MNAQRRVVKSPFTKEERAGVFIPREEARAKRNYDKFKK